MTMTDKNKFEGLTKLPNTKIGAFCKVNRIKIKPDIGVDPEMALADGLSELYKANAMPEFLQVLAWALPPRERVWFACLAAGDLLGDDAEKTPALLAAEAWVFKPNVETRTVVQKAIENADVDDPTVLAADAAYHGIVAGLEDEVKSPPAASPTIVFALVVQTLFAEEGETAIAAKWQSLVARGLNIAAGGNGKMDA
jgi:hypothetical protein